jgi:hypothetical protein
LDLLGTKFPEQHVSPEGAGHQLGMYIAPEEIILIIFPVIP